MISSGDNLQQFRQLRAQAARKKELEARRAQLLSQRQALSSQAETRRKARQEAEQEVTALESGGPTGLLYTIAGGKAQRLETAKKDRQIAKAEDQQAARVLAEAQADLAQTERELESLAGLDDAFAAARQARSDALLAAGLPQSRQLLILEESFAHAASLTQVITDLYAQCQAGLESAQSTKRLAERSEQWRSFSTMEQLQSMASQTVRLQQTLEERLTGLLAQAEAERLRLEEARNDLLAQELSAPEEDTPF